MNTVLLILLAARLIIAVQLTRVSIHQKLPNLMWLAVFFYVTCIGDFFFNVITIMWLFGLGVGLGEIAMVIFIHQTFYRDRKSPWLLFMAIAIIVTITNVYLPLVNPYYFPSFSPFNWIWLIVVGLQAYKQIAADANVENWIKARYKLIVAYSALALMAPIQSIFYIYAFLFPSEPPFYLTPFAVFMNYTVFVATMIGVALQYLAWVMPKAYMRFLNRNYQAPSEAVMSGMSMSEEEILKQLQTR
jgi:uncharacterized membrane protein (DUF485 family)